MTSLYSLRAVARSKYWGGPSISFGQWFSAGWRDENATLDWPQLDGRSTIGLFRGRTAIALACELLGLKAGDEILVPAYNCGTEVDALVSVGLKISAFRVGSDAIIDIDDLKARLTSKTRAVYVIHYFGWEQTTGELRQWCDAHDLKLIEDCALSLFSEGLSGKLGRMGDAAIYSFPKTIGTWHGGLLSLAVPPKGDIPICRNADTGMLLNELKHSARSTVRRGLSNIGALSLLHLRRGRLTTSPEGTRDEFDDMPKGYYFSRALDGNRLIHPQVLRVAMSFSWQDIVAERRANYSYLAERLSDIAGVKLLFSDIPEGVCPLSLPLLVGDRDKCVDRLLKAGISTFPWWSGFHHGAITWKQFPEASWLKRSVLTLPVCQGISGLDQMGNVVDSVLRGCVGPTISDSVV